MIFGIGTDLCAAGRMAEKLQKPAFVEHVFSPAEQALLNARGGTHRAETAAANFAAKEAFSKVLGTGLSGFSLNEVSLLHESTGKPYLRLLGAAKKLADEKGLSFDVSITHTSLVATAVVIGFKGGEK